ncbi:MAG: AraC family transcriptional regulator [Chthoniobacterales bacterium]
MSCSRLFSMDKNCEKLQPPVEKSDFSPFEGYSKPPIVEMDAVVLENVYHYSQVAGKQPEGLQIPPFYERVELVTSGRGWIKNGDTWKEVTTGDLIWNGPGDDTIGKSDLENPYRCLAVTLVSNKKSGLGIPRFSHWPQAEEVMGFTREVVKLFRNGKCERTVLRNYLVSRLLFRVELDHHHRQMSVLPDPLRAALEWLEKNYRHACPIKEVALVSGWSITHLHESFQKYLHTTPHKVLMHHRLRAACERLVSSVQPIKQIATECGFIDASALTHAFKNSGMGLTPKTYRQRYMHLMVK